MDVSIVIVSYNTAELTCAAINSVYTQTVESTFEIIVVDNDSKDGSSDLIRSRFPKLKLISLDENIGFALANNVAANEAQGRYILLLNPDTLILDQAVDKLVAWADQHPEFGVFGGSTFYENGRRNTTSGWMKPSRWSLFSSSIGLSKLFPRIRFFNPESLEYWSWKKPLPVDIVTGCFLLIRKKDWDMLGGFDKQFFMYAEDADLCMRAASKNLVPVIYHDATIIHYGGASEPVRASQMIRLFKAKVQLFRKHYTVKESEGLITLLKFMCISRIFMFTLAAIFLHRLNTRKNEWKVIWDERKQWSV